MAQSAARQWPALPDATPQSLALWARQITKLLQDNTLAQSGDLGTIASQDADAVDITGGSIDGVSITGSAITGSTFDGFPIGASGNRWGVIPVVGADGVAEIGRIIDFHNSDADASDNGGRVRSDDIGSAGQDLSWTPSAGADSGILKRFVTARNSTLAQGDVLYFNGNNFVRLAPGTSGQFLQTLGAGANPAWASGLNVGTPVATTSGDTADFTGISNARLVKIIFSGVSLTGPDDILVQIGDGGGIETTGYTSYSGASVGTAVGTSTNTNGFVIRLQTNTRAFSGIMTLARFDTSSHLWVASLTGEHGAGAVFGGGSKTLSAALDRVRVTNTNTGTNDLDAGSFNVMWQ